MDGASREIHESVGSLVRKGLSVYEIHTDVLEERRPDLIVTQDPCDVCAVSHAEVVEATRELAARVASLERRRR